MVMIYLVYKYLTSFNSKSPLKELDWMTTLVTLDMNKDVVDCGNDTGVSSIEPSPSPWQRTSPLSQSQNEKLQMSEDPLVMIRDMKISKGGLKPVFIVWTRWQATLLSCLSLVSYYSSISPTPLNIAHIHTWWANTAFPPSPVTGRHNM